MPRLKITPDSRRSMRLQLTQADSELAGYHKGLAGLRDLSSENGRVIDSMRDTVNTLLQGVRTLKRIAGEVGL